MARRKKKTADDQAEVVGMFRVNINDADGTIVGDSGWTKNVILHNLIEQILEYLGGIGGPPDGLNSIAYMGLGSTTATTPYSNHAMSDEHLNGTIALRTDTDNSVLNTPDWPPTTYASPTTLQCTGEFPASHFADADSASTSGAVTIGAIGLFVGSVVTDDMYAANTFSSSIVRANQIVTATYKISLGQ